jgi:hypothetical protein
VAEHQTLAAHPGMTAAAEPPTDSIPWANSLFEQPWWLESVAPGAWNAAVARRGDEIVGRLPYVRRRRLGLTTIVQPAFTPVLGPWLAPMEGKYARRLDTEKKLMRQLIDGLPAFDVFLMCFSPTMTNWLPFRWADFTASVCYTYRIEDLSDLDRVQHEFQDHVRRGIRKAGERVEVDHDLPLAELLRLDALTFARRHVDPGRRAAVVCRLDAACAARGRRRILGAVDRSGATHAALYLAWDDRTLYALMSARDPQCHATGANTLLYWEAIRLASEVSRAFDFEGSMVEPIEHYFRGFGGRQTPYFCVTKANLRGKSALAARSAGRALAQRRRRAG